MSFITGIHIHISSQRTSGFSSLLHLFSSLISSVAVSAGQMGTTITILTACGCLPRRNHHQPVSSSPSLPSHSSSQKVPLDLRVTADLSENKSLTFADEGSETLFGQLKRRAAIVSGVSLLVASAVLASPREGSAVMGQGLLAGRIPGLSEPDDQGWRTYHRPDEKSGGHGVGWSPIIPYTFSVPEDWEEVPVSIADLGGTEIDLRFSSSKEGRLSVVVAPVLRFADFVGDATIERIGPPEKVINAFGPEVIGENVEGKIVRTQVLEHLGRTYYQYELEPPHFLITATAAGNRLYLFNVTANGLQWKRHSEDLKRIATSFRVI